MNLQLVKDKLPDFAKDIKLNLSSVLTTEGAPGLQANQIYGIALASAFALNQRELINAFLHEGASLLQPEEIQTAKTAATIMAMNNIYYRFTHLVNDAAFATMPARLRMNVIANPGIAKTDFELYCLAVSAINGCGMCIEAHANELTKAGISKQAIQSSVRIAAVINATATSLNISLGVSNE